jgi:MFS family permease
MLALPPPYSKTNQLFAHNVTHRYGITSIICIVVMFNYCGSGFISALTTKNTCFHASNNFNYIYQVRRQHHHRRQQLQFKRSHRLSNNYFSRSYPVLSRRPPSSSTSSASMDDGDGESVEDEPMLERSSVDKSAKQQQQRFAFNFNSAVRSTTQTESILPKMMRKSTTTATVCSDEAGAEGDRETSDGTIPPQVLQSFALLLLSQFILFLGVGAIVPILPIYGQSIGLSSTYNGVVISAPALALLFVSKFAGKFADTSGRKLAMMSGMAFIAIADVGTACSNSVLTLVCARLGVGIGRGYAEAGERGMLNDFANRVPSLRGRALAFQQACVALGIALGAPLGGLVVEVYGIRSAFLCVSAAAVVAVAIYSILPETKVTSDDDEKKEMENLIKRKPRSTSVTASSSLTNETQSRDDAADWKKLLTTSTWRSLALAQSGASFGYACKIAVVPILANEYLGGPTGAGLLLSAAGLSGLIGAPLGGWLSDVVGSRVTAILAGSLSGASLALIPIGLSLSTNTDFIRLSTMGESRSNGAEALSSTSTTSSSLLDGVFSTLTNFWQSHNSLISAEHSPGAAAFTVLVLLWSMGASAQGPALTALAQENAPAGSEATALGLPRAMGDGTYIIAPLILGYVSDKVGATIPGISCTLAGAAITVGSLALLFAVASEADENQCNEE